MGVEKSYPAGAFIYQSGMPSRKAFIVHKGVVKLVIGTQEILLQEGEAIGMFDTILKRAYSADAIAVGEVLVREIDASEMLSELDGTLTYKVIETMIKKMDSDKPGRWS